MKSPDHPFKAKFCSFTGTEGRIRSPGSNGCADRSNFNDANGRPGTDLCKRCEHKAANSRLNFDAPARSSAGIAEAACLGGLVSAVCAEESLCNISDSHGRSDSAEKTVRISETGGSLAG